MDDSYIHPEWSSLGQIWPTAVNNFHYINKYIYFTQCNALSHALYFGIYSTVWLLGRRLCRLSEELEWTDTSICWPFVMLAIFQTLICSSHLGSCMNNKLDRSEQWRTLKLYMCACIIRPVKRHQNTGYITAFSLYKGRLRCRVVENHTLLVLNLSDHEK